MSGLTPFNRKNSLTSAGSGFEDFYNVLDDFFSDSLMPKRNLLRDTFKIDIEEKEHEYLIEAEVPGIQKEEIDVSIEGDNLLIKVDRQEEVDNSQKNYIHRERRVSSMGRRVKLVNANLDEIKAKIEDGVLHIIVPKNQKVVNSRKIMIE